MLGVRADWRGDGSECVGAWAHAAPEGNATDNPNWTITATVISVFRRPTGISP
jgi:hypothetical protein